MSFILEILGICGLCGLVGGTGLSMDGLLDLWILCLVEG